MNPLFLTLLVIGAFVLVGILALAVNQAIVFLTPLGFLAVLAVAAAFWLTSHSR